MPDVAAKGSISSQTCVFAVLVAGQLIVYEKAEDHGTVFGG